MVGRIVGTIVGSMVGRVVVGKTVGTIVGATVGRTVGSTVGATVGASVPVSFLLGVELDNSFILLMDEEPMFFISLRWARLRSAGTCEPATAMQK